MSGNRAREARESEAARARAISQSFPDLPPINKEQVVVLLIDSTQSKAKTEALYDTLFAMADELAEQVVDRLLK